MDLRASTSPAGARRTSLSHSVGYEHPPPHLHSHAPPSQLVTMPIGEYDEEMYKRRYLAIKPIVHELEDENNLIAYKIKIITPKIRALEEELKERKAQAEKKQRERPPDKFWKGASSDTKGDTKLDPVDWHAQETRELRERGARGYYSSDEDRPLPIDPPPKKGGKKGGKGGKRKSNVRVEEAEMDVDSAHQVEDTRDVREEEVRRRREEDEEEEGEEEMIDDY